MNIKPTPQHNLAMTEKEGVIKYNLNHQNLPINDYISLSEINAWRTVLFKLGMIGQDKKRYEGYGFGNISQKVFLQTTSHNQFIITGTQTGELASLSKHHYCIVLKANPKKNSIQSI